MTTEFLLGTVIRQRRGSEKASPHLDCFHVSSAQNNQCSKAAYFWVAHPEPLHPPRGETRELHSVWPRKASGEVVALGWQLRPRTGRG